MRKFEGKIHTGRMKAEIYKPRDSKDCQKLPEAENGFFPLPSRGSNPAKLINPQSHKILLKNGFRSLRFEGFVM